MTTSRSESEPVIGNGHKPADRGHDGEPMPSRAIGGAEGSAAAPSRHAEPEPEASRAPAPEPSPQAQLAGFEGIRLRLRRTASRRYALGVDIELAVDSAQLGALNTGTAARRGLHASEDVEEEALAGEEEGDEVADEGAFAGDADEEDDDEALALDDDEGEPDGEGEPVLAGEQEERAVGDRWPNQRPVANGVLEISQAPALFDESDDEDEDEGEQEEGEEEAGAAPAGRAGTPFGDATAAERVAAAPAPGRAALAVKRMLDEARKTIGLGEKPPGSNHNRITVWYNKNIASIGNGPWCNMAVTYWAGLSANLLAIFAGKKVGYAYTVAHARKFEQKRRWYKGVAGIRSGDVVFFDWGGSRSIQRVDHVGVVELVKGKSIITIEGNTTGDRCRRMVRDAKFIVGYGRPAYGS